MSLSDIRASLQSNWAQWDITGDGNIGGDDFLSAFDKNKDGNLGRDELNALAEQLSTQLEYNNSLLEQMRSLEEMQLAGQRELLAKQEAVKQLSDANDAMNEELRETKRKLKITQEIADSMSKQSRDARVEANALKREAENAAKGYTEGKDLLRELTEERARLQKALKKADNDLRDAEEKAEQDRMDLMHQNDILRQTHEALSLEAAELRSRVIPIESEKKSLKDHVLSLARSLEETTKRCEEEATARALAEKRIKDMTHAMDALRDKHREMQYLVQQANGKSDASGASVKQLEAQVDDLENQLSESEGKVTTLTQAVQQAARDRESLEQELEQMGNELVAHAKQRQMDQDRWASKLAKAHKDMDAAAHETKASAEEFVNEAQRRTAEAIDAHRQAEEKYLAIQIECGELHSLIQQTQIDHQSALEGWQAQQEELEGIIADLERKLELSGEEVENVHSILVADREKAQKIIRAVKAEMMQRGERYVAMLSTLQTAVKRLKDDSVTNREFVREVMAQFAVLRAFCEQLWDKTHPPLEAWKVELAGVFKKLVVKFKGLKDAIEDGKDDIRRAQLGKEEERSKTLMLEESVSRLEHELSAYENKVEDNDSRATEKLNQQKSRIDDLVKERADMEQRLQRMQQSLDAATSQARTLQAANHSIQNTLGDSTAKNSAVKQEVQGKLNQLAAQLKRATQERDQQAKVAEDLQLKLDRAQAAIHQSMNMSEQSKADIQKQQSDNEAVAQKHAQAIAAMQATTNQYQEQLKHTQELLKVVQAQRAELQTQNQQLRSEIDETYDARSHRVSHFYTLY
jgi:chromosome segregation protein